MPQKVEHYTLLRGKTRVETYFGDKIAATELSADGANLMRVAMGEMLIRLKCRPGIALAVGDDAGEEWFECVDTTRSLADGDKSSVYLPSREEITAKCEDFIRRRPRSYVRDDLLHFDGGFQIPICDATLIRRAEIEEAEQICDCPYWGTEGKE